MEFLKRIRQKIEMVGIARYLADVAFIYSPYSYYDGGQFDAIPAFSPQKIAIERRRNEKLRFRVLYRNCTPRERKMLRRVKKFDMWTATWDGYDLNFEGYWSVGDVAALCLFLDLDNKDAFNGVVGLDRLFQPDDEKHHFGWINFGGEEYVTPTSDYISGMPLFRIEDMLTRVNITEDGYPEEPSTEFEVNFKNAISLLCERTDAVNTRVDLKKFRDTYLANRNKGTR